jgi:hypothetical protein
MAFRLVWGHYWFEVEGCVPALASTVLVIPGVGLDGAEKSDPGPRTTRREDLVTLNPNRLNQKYQTTPLGLLFKRPLLFATQQP